MGAIRKKITSLFLCISIIFIVLPQGITASAETCFGSCGDNLTWSFGRDTGVLTISGTGMMNDYYGYYYTSAPWGPFIKEVEIENGVTSIGSYAFSGCTSLNSISIPNSVTSIEEGVFKDCSSLTNITIPDGVKSIGNRAFEGCTGLTSINIPSSVTTIGGDGAFMNCTGLESITVESGNTVYHSADNCIIETKNKTLILGCKNSIIPKNGSVTSIGADAFCYCTGLTSITIPHSVTSIGGAAFYCCSGLTSIRIPDSVVSIGSHAFNECTGLKSITISDGITSIGYEAFFGCSIKNLTISDGSKTINSNMVVSKWTLENITIPNSVTTICDNAFSGCISLNSVNIPNSVTSIGNGVFKNCSGLTSITIPASVTSIGDNAFYGCSGLESITAETDNTIYHSAGNCLIETESKTLITGCKNSVIPTDGSVTSIGDNAFYGCTGLVSMKIPDSVTSVGDGAFLGCTNLETLIVPNGLNITQASVDISKVKHTYSIIYNSGIGTNIDPQTKITSESVQLASNAKNGYLFKGWSDEKNGKVIYLPGAVYSDDANIVLYGIWAKTCPKTTTSFEPCPNAKCKNGYVGTQNCTECNGTGWLYNSTKCSKCNGWGFKNIYHIDKSVICPYCKGIIGLNKDCTWCHGCGYYVTKIEKKNCAKCDGKGSIITTKGLSLLHKW